MSKSRTPFVETEILLSWMEDDTESVDDMLREMLPGERREYRRQLVALRLHLDTLESKIQREQEEEEARALIKRLEQEEPTIRGGYNDIEL